MATVQVDGDAAELLGELEPVAHPVHHEDPRGAEEVRGLEREQAHRPRPEDGHAVARPDPRVLRAAISRREDIAEEERVLIRHARGHRLAHVIRERHADPLGLAARILLAEAAAEDSAARGYALGG